MNRTQALLGLLGALAMLPVYAAQPQGRPVQAIPVYSVSPGSSGSVSGSAWSQRYEVQDGVRLPSGGYSIDSNVSGSSSVQQQGGIRQSTQYPNGLRIEGQPGQSGYEYQRSR